MTQQPVQDVLDDDAPTEAEIQAIEAEIELLAEYLRERGFLTGDQDAVMSALLSVADGVMEDLLPTEH